MYTQPLPKVITQLNSKSREENEPRLPCQDEFNQDGNEPRLPGQDEFNQEGNELRLPGQDEFNQEGNEPRLPGQDEFNQEGNEPRLPCQDEFNQEGNEPLWTRPKQTQSRRTWTQDVGLQDQLDANEPTAPYVKDQEIKLWKRLVIGKSNPRTPHQQPAT